MFNIAVFGAGSQIAQDWINNIIHLSEFNVDLYTRNNELIILKNSAYRNSNNFKYLSYDLFADSNKYNLIINFVGIANPKLAAEMNKQVAHISEHYDLLALNYLQKNKHCRYIFISSGASFGNIFSEPVTNKSISSFSDQASEPSDWYGWSKFQAEKRHREKIDLPIVDLRIFSYFSSNQQLESSLLMSNILKSIHEKKLLITNQTNPIRDYIGPQEFGKMIAGILKNPPINAVVDFFSLAPVSKFALLDAISKNFALRYEIIPDIQNQHFRNNYFSLNYHAKKLFQYQPDFNSIEIINNELTKFLNR